VVKGFLTAEVAKKGRRKSEENHFYFHFHFHLHASAHPAVK